MDTATANVISTYLKPLPSADGILFTASFQEAVSPSATYQPMYSHRIITNSWRPNNDKIEIQDEVAIIPLDNGIVAREVKAAFIDSKVKGDNKLADSSMFALQSYDLDYNVAVTCAHYNQSIEDFRDYPGAVPASKYDSDRPTQYGNCCHPGMLLRTGSALAPCTIIERIDDGDHILQSSCSIYAPSDRVLVATGTDEFGDKMFVYSTRISLVGLESFVVFDEHDSTIVTINACPKDQMVDYLLENTPLVSVEVVEPTPTKVSLFHKIFKKDE